MSGGHYEYAYRRVQGMAAQTAGEIISREPSERVARQRFADQLFRVADAMRALERHDSSDASDWDDVLKRFAAIGGAA